MLTLMSITKLIGCAFYIYLDIVMIHWGRPSVTSSFFYSTSSSDGLVMVGDWCIYLSG